MSTINLDSQFVSYNLTEQETLQGQVLQVSQREVLQNMLFQQTMLKLNLKWSAENMQEEAELSGGIRMLQSILDNSKLAEEALGRALDPRSVTPSERN